MNKLSPEEFQFVREALRNSAFNNHGCGCQRKNLVAERIVQCATDEDVLTELDFDVERLIRKLHEMSGPETASLVEQINHCYFVEAMNVGATDEGSHSSRHDSYAEGHSDGYTEGFNEGFIYALEGDGDIDPSNLN